MVDLLGLSQLLDSFDLFLLDQFGVLHDGERPYPKSISALQLLRDSGKSIAIISNSGKRAAVNERRMVRLGFERALYDCMITSGEVAWTSWATMCTDTFTATDRPIHRCFLITSNNDSSAVDGLDLELTHEPGEADLIWISATEGDRYSLDYYRTLLAPAARRQTPCLCTNPDKIAFAQNGPCFGAGRIAEIYEELGGPVRWVGKPYPEIYRFTLSNFADVPDSRVLCVGDSIEHDIAGATRLGLHSLLVTGGVLAGHSMAELAVLAKRHDAAPHYLMRALAP